MSFPNQMSGSVPSVVGPVEVPSSKILNTYLLQGQVYKNVSYDSVETVKEF